MDSRRQQPRKWTDRQESPQLISLSSVLAKLVRSEEEKWLQIGAGRGVESPLQAEAATRAMRNGEMPLAGGERLPVSTVSNNCLVEHGRMTKQIHDYFGMLERNRVLLNMGAPRTFNNMRVVKSDNDIGDGSDTRAASGLKRATVLAGEDLTLYRGCLMCTQFPALCAPDLPSPSATPQSEIHIGRHHSQVFFPSSIGTSKRPCPPFGLPSPFDGVSQEIPLAFSSSPELAIPLVLENDDVVTVDWLKMYVRDLFQQTDQQQLSHERDLREINYRRNPAEILAKELVTQLSSLDSNSQPYYQLQSFVSKNAYDQWVQWEKQKIRHLISLFWRYSLPRPVVKGRRPNYHALYRKLLSKIVSLETKARKRHHIVLKDSAPSRPLSAKATRILREFGLRFGVGELYRRLVYLEYLARHFENDVWYVQHTNAVLSSVLDLLPTDLTKMIITKDELDIVKTSIQHLHREAEHSLTRIKRLFPENDPQEGLASLIELLQTALSGYQYINSTTIPLSLRESLQQYVMDGFVKSYERHKTIAQGEMGVLSVTQPVTPELIGSTVVFIQDEVASYSRHFQAALQEYFNVTELATTEFYRMLCDDVVAMCKRYTPSEDKLDLEMLTVAYKLNELDRQWSSWISPERQLWRDNFIQQAKRWLDAVGNQLLDWVVKSVACDEWSILELSPASQRPKSSSQPKSPSPGVEVASPKPISSLEPSFRSAFTRVSRVRGEDLDVSCLVDGTSSIDGSISSQQSSISLVESIQSRLSSKPRSREPSVKDDELMASLEQASALGLAESFLTSSMDPEQGTGRHSVDGKPSKVLTFGSVSASQDNGQEQSPGFVRRTRSLVDRGVTERKEVQYGGSKRRRRRRHAQVEGSSQPVDIAVEKDALENATPIAICVRRPSVLQTMSNYALNRTPSPLKQGRPNTVVGCESTGRTRPITIVTAEESLEKQVRNASFKRVSCDQPDPTSEFTVDALMPGREQLCELDSSTAAALCDDARSESITDTLDGSQSLEPSPEMNAAMRSCDLTDSFAGITEGIFCPIDNARPSKPPLLPVSSSVVDIVTALKRLARFTGTLNHILRPRLSGGSGRISGLTDESQAGFSDCGRSSTESFLAEDLDDTLRDKLGEVILCTLIVYVDNMLCTDLCGVSEQVARKLIGDELLSQLQECKQKQLVWGCRHMVPLGQQLQDYYILPDCLQYEKAGRRLDFERVTFDMCVRINNVAALLGILPALHNHLMRVAGVSRVFSPARDLSSSFDSGYQYGSPTHLATAPSVAPVKQKYVHREANVSCQSVSSAVSSSGSDSPFVHNIAERLANVQKCQIRLLCYRLNNFIKPCLKALMSLVLPEKLYPLERRLDPVIRYLSRHLSALADCLYPESFMPLLQCLWDSLVADFKEFIDELLNAREDSRHLARLYLRAIALLVEFLHAAGTGLDMDTLVTNAAFVFELLELHALPTRKLTLVHNQLLKQEKTDTSLNSDSSCLPSLVGDLRQSLHRLRKCFSGQDFTDAVVALPRKAAPFPYAGERTSSLSVTGCTIEYEYALRLGQQLLDAGVIQGVAKLRDESQPREPTPTGVEHQFTGSTSHLYRFATYQDCPGDDLNLSHSSSSSSLSSSEVAIQDAGERGEQSCTYMYKASENHLTKKADSACVMEIIQARCRYDQSAKQFVRLSQGRSPCTDK